MTTTSPAAPSAAARLALGLTFMVYLGGTALLYFWGPWHFPMAGGQGALVRFLVAVHLAFAIGYLLGVRGQPAAARCPVAIDRVVLAAALTELLLLFPTSAYSTGSWFPRPWAAAGDLAHAYTRSLHLREQGTPYTNYIRMALAPLLSTAVPLGIFYWRVLTMKTRVALTASVVGTIALFVAMGASAGAGQWAGLFPWFVLSSHLAGVQRLDARAWSRAAGWLAVSVLIAICLFGASMVQRAGSYAKGGVMPGINARVTNAAPTTNGAVPTRSGPRIAMDGLAAYLTQGYYAVYLSLEEPFVPCYGFGNSVFLQRQLARLTGDNRILECPYPVRLEKRGWRASVYWASIYPWIASDLTFPGTVLMIGLIGWLAGRVWLDCLSGANPFAVALLGQVLVLLYYIPAHNKVMHSGEGVLSFWVLTGAWVITRRSRWLK